MKAGQNITISVTILSITSFERRNEHIPSRPLENFVCISMQDSNGVIYTSMTRDDTRFAMDVRGLQAGDSIVVGAKVKEFRNCEKYGPRWAITNCVLGGFKTPAATLARKAKAEKRMQALLS